MSTNQVDLLKLFQKIKWAENGDVASFSETNYGVGWSFLGDDTPTVEDFNAIQQWNDKKDQWLFGQIAAICQAENITVSEQDLEALHKAIKQMVRSAIAKLVGSAPAELDTLEELAAMLAENGDLRRTLLQKIGEKAPLSHKHTTADIEGLTAALDEAGKKGLPVGAVVAFPRAVANPIGFLKCDGTTFTQSLYPDLYRVLGNKNQLPDLTRSDVGMTAYFATDNIPAGWIAFDQIRTQVTQSVYPELYRHLVAKYGSIEAVPLAEDRFLRNAHGDLTVGQTQSDAIRNITGTIGQFSDRANRTIAGAFNTQNWGEGASLGGGRQGVKIDFDASRVVPTDTENRPKSLVLKLCIKARNSLDDVQFWIKAFGGVSDVGLMDASQIAIALQGKADNGHPHRYAEITDFTVGVAAAFSQNLAENGWQKLPNELLEQWGKITLNPAGGSGTDTQVVFPVRFPSEVLNVQVSYGLMTNARITQDTVLSELSLSGMTIRQQTDRGVVVYWRVIGK